MLHDGLYEQVINKGLESELASADKLSETAPIDAAEASKVLAKYIAEVVERGLDNLRDNGGDLKAQVALANQIITTIQGPFIQIKKQNWNKKLEYSLPVGIMLFAKRKDSSYGYTLGC